ncbi:MAG: VUT family protein [Paracoccaceae bacterium]
MRDAVHEILGARWAVGAIIAGAILSYLLADPFIALASLAAFAISEFSDFAVYSKLRERSKYLAMGASGIVGSIIDSVIFLWLAFGSLAHVEGQIIGKIGVTLIATAAVWFWRRKGILGRA